MSISTDTNRAIPNLLFIIILKNCGKMHIKFKSILIIFKCTNFLLLSTHHGDFLFCFLNSLCFYILAGSLLNAISQISFCHPVQVTIHATALGLFTFTVATFLLEFMSIIMGYICSLSCISYISRSFPEFWFSSQNLSESLAFFLLLLLTKIAFSHSEGYFCPVVQAYLVFLY